MARSPAGGMDTRDAPAAKAEDAEAPQRVTRDTCALEILRTFLTQEEIILAHTGMCCLLLPQTQRIPRIHLPSV